jgi:nitroimidazol reductase NimA-like FMN-containing flavoprotein (pyridoxamine 5'-phosphate oxidase superfamily)
MNPHGRFVVAEDGTHFGAVAPNRFRKHRERVIVLIQELTRQGSLDLLARAHLGRLACAQAAQPYVVPIYFAYRDNCLYGFSTLGQKIDWMRSNPLVCVEADEVVSSEQWMSVIVFGRFEELSDAPEWENARLLAHDLLQRKPMWWEPGYVKTILHGTERSLVPVFYRIHIVKLTGHRASPEPGNAV